jgi:hypothetical protein
MSDPVGSIYFEYFHTRQPPKDAKGCTYLVEGIGEDHVCKAIDFNVVDKMWQFKAKKEKQKKHCQCVVVEAVCNLSCCFKTCVMLFVICIV